MDDRAVSELFVSEMLGLLGALRAQITALRDRGDGRDPASRSEFLRLTSALFDLSAAFGLEDIAMIARSLSAAPEDQLTNAHEGGSAAVARALDYVADRLHAFSSSQVITPATGTEISIARDLTHEIATGGGSVAVQGAADFGANDWPGALDAPVFGWEMSPQPAGAGLEEQETTLTDAEVALVAQYQATPLRPNPGVRSSPGYDELTQHAAEPEAIIPSNGAMLDGGVAAGDEQSPSVNDAVHSMTPAAARSSPTPDELDEIPADLKRLFLVETDEDLHEMRVALIKLGDAPHDAAALHTMRGLAHKIRGSAGTFQFPCLEKIALAYEELLKVVQQRNLSSSSHATSALLQGLDLLQEGLTRAGVAGDADAGAAQLVNGLVEQLRPASEAPSSSPARAAGLAHGLTDEVVDSDMTAKMPAAAEGDSSLRVEVRRLETLVKHATQLTINRAGLSHFIETISRLQGEMELSIARLSHLSGELADAPGPLSSLGARGQGGAGVLPRLTSSSHFARAAGRGAPLEGALDLQGPQPRTQWDELELERLSQADDAMRALAETTSDLNANAHSLKVAITQLSRLSASQAELATEIQRDVMHVRLVPLSELVPRLHFEVKRVAAQVHKEVLFRVRGEMTHIDRDISEALAEPLTQLVRNAVTHGIEPADERRELGKPEVGEVWMNAYYVGGEVVIEIGDDGGGVNPNKMAYRAVMEGRVSESSVREMSDQQKLELMFLLDITELPTAGSVGGQGIGLFAVRSKITALKGTILTRSVQGSGAVFRVRVPISLSIVRALYVHAGQEVVAVPLTSVLHVADVHPMDILTSADGSAGAGAAGFARAQRSIRVEAQTQTSTGELQYETVPLFALSDLLNLASGPPVSKQQALIIEIGRRRVAVLVDGNEGESEVVVQALPAHLKRHAVRGATVTPDGYVRIVLDLPELINEYSDAQTSSSGRGMRPTPRLTRALAPRVLVVDDSVSIRKTLELTLTRAHFDVQFARDGVEALEMMLVTPPRVVVLDIEMPRLDGFELLTMMRESPQFEQVRVVMLTSRASEKHRAHALALGASAYLVKPCPQEILIDTVRGLLNEQSPS